MRILHIVPSYFPAVRYGGPIWSVHGLAKAQAALGHDVHVFTTNADGPNRLNVQLDRPVDLDGVSVHYFPLGIPARLYRAPMLARALNKQIKTFDVVHLHSVFLWPTLKAARSARRASVPYIVAPRGMMVKELLRARSAMLKRAWIALFERKTLEQAAFIHVTAEVEATELRAFGFALPSIESIANGVEPPGTWDQSSVAGDVSNSIAQGPYFLSLGRLSWKKNLLALLGALGKAPSTRLIMVGNDDEGHAAELAGHIAARGLANRVSLIARSVDGADKEALFAGCQFFVLPSLSENFGNTALEAMARGKAVIVSDGCGVAELVAQSHGGLVSKADEESLALAIKQLWEAPHLADEMGAAGQECARQSYGWPSIAQQMDKAYAKAGIPVI